MVRINRNPLFVLLMLAMSAGFWACEDKVPEEPTSGETAEIPAEPPMNDKNVAPETVYFAFDSDALSSQAQSQLSSLANSLKGGNVSVQIEGHCDERGSTQYNLALGQRRADSVKRYLQGLGVNAAHITTISYGEEKPAVVGHDESAWSQNRRAEFITSGQ